MQGDGDAKSEGAISGLLTQLEDRLRADLGNAASVERSEFLDGEGFQWEVQPANPRSVHVYWLEWGAGIKLFVGSTGAPWDLARTPGDIDFLESVVRAAIAGRVVETAAMGRSRVDVTLQDGQVVHQTNIDGCLFGLVPLPGWRRWGELTRYEPYASPSSSP